MNVSGSGRADQTGSTYQVYGAEQTSAQILARYKELLNILLKISAKKEDLTPPDDKNFEEALKELLDLKNAKPCKLEYSMVTDLDKFLLFLGEAGLNTDKDPLIVDISILNKVRNFKMIITDKDGNVTGQIDIIKALLVALPEKERGYAIKNLGDLLIDIAGLTEAAYNKKIAELEKSLTITTKILKDLGVIKGIANQTTVESFGGKWTWPITQLSDIPKEVQDALMNAVPPIIVGYEKKVINAETGETVDVPVYIYKTNADGSPILDEKGNKIFLQPNDSFINDKGQVVTLTEWINDNKEIYLKASSGTTWTWTWPITNKGDIPKAVQDALMKDPPIIIGYGKDGKPVYAYTLDKDGNKVLNTASFPNNKGGTSSIFTWIEDNKEDYLKMSVEAFKNPPVSIPAPKEDAIYQLLTARDDLIAQLKALKAAGGDSSQIEALEKILAKIDKEFPRDKFPEGCAKDYRIETKDEEGNVTYTYKYPEGADKAIKAWIQLGIDGDSILEDIDIAVQTNSNLSSEMSDKMKEENQKLTQIFDVLSQIAKSWDRIIMGMAQKVKG